jgi:hypothetical protein
VNSPQRHRLDQREQGRRRVAIATRSSAFAGTALAAAFGLALAQHGTAAAKPHAPADVTVAPSTTTPPAAPAPSTTTSTVPPAPTTTIAPTTTTPPPATTLQPPVQAPTVARGSGGSGSSGGS